MSNSSINSGSVGLDGFSFWHQDTGATDVAEILATLAPEASAELRCVMGVRRMLQPRAVLGRYQLLRPLHAKAGWLVLDRKKHGNSAFCEVPECTLLDRARDEADRLAMIEFIGDRVVNICDQDVFCEWNSLPVPYRTAVMARALGVDAVSDSDLNPDPRDLAEALNRVTIKHLVRPGMRLGDYLLSEPVADGDHWYAQNQALGLSFLMTYEDVYEKCAYFASARAKDIFVRLGRAEARLEAGLPNAWLWLDRAERERYVALAICEMIEAADALATKSAPNAVSA